MYIPAHFESPDREATHQLMKDYPLATLVTMGVNGMEANHIPLHFSTEPLSPGTLRGHVARANPMWRHLVPEVEVLAIFHGPEAYISPSWYASKKRDGKVVPTWNYAVVHAYGKLQIKDDPVWLREQLETLTAAHESNLPQPWAVGDAPADYIGNLLKAVVGIEIQVTRLQGKWKMSQNQPPENRMGVVKALEQSGQGDVAGLIRPG